jgi:ribosome-associated protein
MKIGGISSVGRAPAWHAGGQRFESAMLHFLFPSGGWQPIAPFLPPRDSLTQGGFFIGEPLTTMAIEGKELAIACARAAEEIQAEDVRVLDLTGVSSLTDFMVVCSGTSLPHLKAVMRDVEKEIIKKYDVHTVNTEGNADSRWVVMDYIDVMVHIMHQEMRDLYGLEDLWAKGKEVEWMESE